ncbi:MAG: hypothetical protein PHY28_06175 [Dehalococcoidales bacterium]|nr:hypothetical protein [Dehalococcoidales bacterium]
MKTSRMRFEEVQASHPGDRLLRRLRKPPNVLMVICRKIVRFTMSLIRR